TVFNVSGPPLAGATVTVGSIVITTSANGATSLLLPNGTYRFDVFDGGYLPVSALEIVDGGLGPLVFRLTPLPLYVVLGLVRDSHSGHPISGVNVTIAGAYGFSRTVATGPDGGFRLSAPNGTDYLSAQGPRGFGSTSLHVVVAGGVTQPVIVSLDPTGVSVSGDQPVGLAVLLPIFAVVLAAIGIGVWAAQRERAMAGLPSAILSPFGRFVAMRLILIPVQGIFILTVLFIFGTFFPAIIHQANPCSLLSSGCTSCSWSNYVCVARAFAGGLWTFLVNLFTGSWGYATYNHLSLPAVQFLDWWAPNSIELALVALPLSALIAYPLGLISGWRRDGPVDSGIRVGSLIGLLVPSFLIVLLLLGSAYTPFTNTLGDTPYGLLPTPVWFAAHGGQPAWIGEGSNTSPTGFAMIDGALHADWSFEYLVIAKTLLQAFAIAALYSAIYLRFARHAVAEAAGAPYITAARARGVPNSSLLWRHTRRRVLPIFVLIFGLTLPVYIGTQALVEALFSDQGVGTLLLGEMTHVQSTAFGFATASQGYHVGNFYQVTIFLLVFVVLIGNLFSDILARVLDPRTAEPRAR
ncbi:MAG: ABC transporter permease subunit, partial [Thermoplasmata archaeon]|nr:ABC transporter permease subunit [Thermoplasmata archaeon]